MEKNGLDKWQSQELVEAKLMELFRGMVEHDGISRLQVEVKPLKKGRKNVVLSSGKDFHYVIKPFVPPRRDQGKPIQAPAEKN